MNIGSRMRKAWNILTDRKAYDRDLFDGPVYYDRPDRRYPALTVGNERSIVMSIFNRIALDCSEYEFVHCLIDDEKKFKEEIASDLNECLQLSANKDQTGRALIIDIVTSVLDEGCVAVVPVEVYGDLYMSDSYRIYSMRVGSIKAWKPDAVCVELYDDRDGKTKTIWTPKRATAIIENPLYSVINRPNSTAQRLKRKIALLDYSDEEAASGRLDMLISLPYQTKTELKRRQAQKRVKEIEYQLKHSKYGVAYIDGTEKVTQLNRPISNQLLEEIESLQKQLYTELNLTEEILNGTADETAMTNYFSRTITPFVDAILDEFKRKFLTKTARTQGQSIMAFRDPFRLVPVTKLAEMADVFERNEVLSSNEVRQAIGRKPSDDPKADRLENSNMPHPAVDESDSNILNKEDYENNEW